MTYEEAQVISQLGSMTLFMGLLAGALVYAFRSGNRAKFEKASRAPLDQDEDLERRNEA